MEVINSILEGVNSFLKWLATPAEQGLREAGAWIEWAGASLGLSPQGTLNVSVFVLTIVLVAVVALVRRIEAPPHTPISLDMATDFAAASVVVGLSTLVAVGALHQAPAYSAGLSILWSAVPAVLGAVMIYVSRVQAKFVRTLLHDGGLLPRDRTDCHAFMLTAFIVFGIADRFAIQCIQLS